MSKSTNISQSGTHRATGGPTLQGRPSYTTTARRALSDEGFEGSTGVSPPATSVPSQSSRRRDHRPTDSESIAIPSNASTGHRAKTKRRDTSQFDVELDVQSRAGQSSSIPASKDARAAQREGITSPGPNWPASSPQLTHPVTTSPPSGPSRNVLPQALQETGINTPLRPLRPEERRERNEFPYPQADTRNERTVSRTHAGQGDGTTSVLPSAKPSTTHPPPSAKPSAPSPPPLKRPSASASLLLPPTGTPHSTLRPSASIPLLSSPPAPASAKTVSSQMNTPKGALPSDPQAPSSGATFESPHSADRGFARPRADGPGRKDLSSLSQTASHRPPPTLEYTPATTESPWPGHKDAFAAPHITPIHPEHIPTAMERPSWQDHKDPSAASHRPPVAVTGYVPDITQYQNAPTGGSVQRAGSSYRGHGYDSSAAHLPDTSNSRKTTGPSLYTAPGYRREAPITPPTALVYTQNQPKDLIRETSMSHTNSTTSSANLLSQPPSLPSNSRTQLTSDKSSVFLAY